MLLAIDIGNSNIVIGGIEHDQIRFEAPHRHRPHQDLRPVRRGDQEPAGLLQRPPVPGGGLHHLFGGSAGVQLRAHRACQADRPYTYGGGSRHQDRAEHPHGRPQLGGQRPHRHRRGRPPAVRAPPLTLVDMGTATTIEVVDCGNTYLGGCIIPGVPGVRRGPVQPRRPAARHPAGQAPPDHRQEHGGVHAQRHHVRRRRHAGRHAGPHRGGAGQAQPL